MRLRFDLRPVERNFPRAAVRLVLFFSLGQVSDQHVRNQMNTDARK